MKYFINPCTDPYRNMAFDEWCLEHGPEEPVFYLWRNRPSVIVGFNQVAGNEVNLDYLREHGILLVRRVTGGGAVYHDLQNLNYSFVGPLHTIDTGLITDALTAMGLNVERTGRNDIFLDGRKISGYARRVWKNRELIHGTLMYDVDIETLTAALNVEGSKLNRKGVASVRSRVTNIKDYLPGIQSIDEFQQALQKILEEQCCAELGVLTERQQAEIEKLAADKFASPEWILKPKEAD
ncbi:MAG: lipoate--protein ligase family protein [Bacteroidales bacterium]|nr:lipoate--protein ligase family protein [Bacteroidales bacterium]